MYSRSSAYIPGWFQGFPRSYLHVDGHGITKNTHRGVFFWYFLSIHVPLVPTLFLFFLQTCAWEHTLWEQETVWISRSYCSREKKAYHISISGTSRRRISGDDMRNSERWVSSWSGRCLLWAKVTSLSPKSYSWLWPKSHWCPRAVMSTASGHNIFCIVCRARMCLLLFFIFLRGL